MIDNNFIATIANDIIIAIVMTIPTMISFYYITNFRLKNIEESSGHNSDMLLTLIQKKEVQEMFKDAQKVTADHEARIRVMEAKDGDIKVMQDNIKTLLGSMKILQDTFNAILEKKLL